MGDSFSATTLFWFLYSVIRLTPVTSQITNHNFKYRTENILDNTLIPGELGSFSDRSLLECAAECSLKHGACLAFEYHATSKQCSLSGYFPPLLLSFLYGNGSKVYYSEEYVCGSYPYHHSVAYTTVQTITSPNYPGPYFHNLDVTWQIIKPLSSTLFLSFQMFDLEYVDDCRWDSVSFYTGSCDTDLLKNTLCANNLQSHMISEGLYVLIRFKTDGNNDGLNYYGFVLNYYIV